MLVFFLFSQTQPSSSLYNNNSRLPLFTSLMLGFMLPTWFLSMWISNTATAAMMLPMVEAVLDQLEKDVKATSHHDHTIMPVINTGTHLYL